MRYFMAIKGMLNLTQGGKRMKRISTIIFLMLALLLGLTPAVTAVPPAQDSYIVVLHDNVPSPAAAAREIAQFVGGQVGFIYEHALKGFSIKLPPQAVGVLQMNPRVKYVDIDASGMPLPRPPPPASSAFSPMPTKT
jgi:hypothetical protein